MAKDASRRRGTHRTVRDGQESRINGVLVTVRRRPGKGWNYRVTVVPSNENQTEIDSSEPPANNRV